MKKSLKILFGTILLFSSTSLIFATVAANSFYLQSTSNESSSPSIFSIDQKGLVNVTEKATTFTYVDPVTDVSWYNQKTSEQVINQDLLELLVPANPEANFFVERLPSTNFTNINGYVEFNVYQVLRTFVNGVSNGSDTIAKISPVGNQAASTVSGASTIKDVWITPANLVRSQKFSFSWRSDEEIGSYVSNTLASSSTLTVSDVLLNMVLQDSLNILPKGITLAINDLSGIANSGKSYGVSKLVLTLPTTNDVDWQGGSKPTTNQLTKIVRGLNISVDNSSNIKSKMDFVTNYDSTTIKSIELDPTKKPIFGNVLLPSENYLVDLTPSELVNINNGDPESLINLFVKGDYLDSSVTNKIIDIKYMGLSFTNPNFSTLTEIDASISSRIGVTNILSYPNDLDGSLKLVYEYSYYDIFFNKIVSSSFTQVFEPGTFKSNPDSDKTLTFTSWKQDTFMKTLFSNSYDLVNVYNGTLDSIPDVNAKKDFMTSFSNLFFNGSNAAYEKIDRTVTIDYASGHTVDANTNKWISKNADLNVTVTITFDTWNGNIYQEGSNDFNGLKVSHTFKLSNYDTNVPVTWSSVSSPEITNLKDSKPSEIALQINKQIPQSIFFETGKTVTSCFIPYDNIGSLSVTINIDGINYTNTFFGFLPFRNNGDVISFIWVPQSLIPQPLLSKSVDEVTDIEIFDLIKSVNPFIQTNESITVNNMTAVRSQEHNNITVLLTIPFFDQSSPTPVNQTFSATLSGFSSLESIDIAKYPGKGDPSILIGGVIGGVVAGILLIILIYQIVKIYRFRNVKKIS